MEVARTFGKARPVAKFSGVGRFLDVLPYLLPALLVFTVFEYYPLLRVIYLSFTDADLLRAPNWVGLENYQQIFTRREFHNSLVVTTIFAVSVTLLLVGLGMALAFLMNVKTRFQSFLRGAIFAPTVVSVTASALIWLHMMNPNGGPLNAILQALGFEGVRWLAHPQTALASVILIAVWMGVGLSAVIFLAGLQGIPRELEEAARVDGASPWQAATRITIPLLAPTTMVVFFLALMGTFRSYGLILVLNTDGGPVGSTNLLGWYIYQNAFQFFQMGYASALSVVLLLLLLFLAWVQFKATEGRVHYQ
ncbi:carbohydrate ABC transporter permease [uncultured Meiothermus sp.]|uniref:carbohydrate ABC transporter permease n=1 Tax=uncultured Meiothermus sp. TaxID=157471 RepID=UPI002624745C|nr:sugar ABC transporter permease [uncultured Meiothermus sp.]